MAYLSPCASMPVRQGAPARKVGVSRALQVLAWRNASNLGPRKSNLRKAAPAHAHLQQRVALGERPRVGTGCSGHGACFVTSARIVNLNPWGQAEVEMYRLVHWVIIGALALSAAGCADGDDEAPIIVVPRDFGSLTTEWSVFGSLDPQACADVGADRFELLIYDDFGVFFSEAEAPCEAFSLTVDLPAGRFSADATLVDAFDGAVSTTTTLDALDIVVDTDLVVSVDFPPGSIL